MLGKEILHYKILEKLGEGGMGVVYKTEDTRLERPVAIKFLPREIAAQNDVKKLFLIKRGDNINIFYNELNMNITFSAIAMQNGVFNDIIKVKTSNGKIINIRVIGRKKGKLI